MFSDNSNNAFNLQSIDILEYIDLDENDIPENQRPLMANMQRNQNYQLCSKIKMKAGLAFIRVFYM